MVQSHRDFHSGLMSKAANMEPLMLYLIVSQGKAKDPALESLLRGQVIGDLVALSTIDDTIGQASEYVISYERLLAKNRKGMFGKFDFKTLFDTHAMHKDLPGFEGTRRKVHAIIDRLAATGSPFANFTDTAP